VLQTQGNHVAYVNFYQGRNYTSFKLKFNIDINFATQIYTSFTEKYLRNSVGTLPAACARVSIIISVVATSANTA